jgi:glycosyltransferase involved in cell wall biosynthesis
VEVGEQAQEPRSEDRVRRRATQVAASAPAAIARALNDGALSRPLRILHVVQGYTPAVGGSERVIQRLSEELVAGHRDRITVFTTNCRNAEAFPRPSLPSLALGWETVRGVDVRRFRVVRNLGPLLGPLQSAAFRLGVPFNDHLRTWYAGPIIPGLARAVRRYDADIIAATSFPLRHMYQALRGAHASGRPCVLIGGIHPDDRWGYDRPMINRAAARADLYVAYTKLEARHVIEHGASADRVEVIGVGVDPGEFASVDPEPLRRELGIGDAPVVGFIGQLGVHKGIAHLVAAMEEVWQRHPAARLLIAGARTVFSKSVEELVARLPGAQRQRVLLRLDFSERDKPRLMSLLDVLAYPSQYESYGIAFLEAWAAAKPVIGCRCGAVAEVVRDDADGLLVPYADPRALAAAISALLDDPGRARALGAAGRRRVLAEHTWPAIAARFRDAYVRTIARAAHGANDARASAFSG